MASQPREKTAETLGANVRYLREHASISQTELARRMAEHGWPWHQSTVYRVESGRQPVRFEEAVDLADLLGTTLDRLTWAIGEAAEQELVDGALNRLRHSIVDAVEALTQFYAARARARRAARDAAASDYAHVREAAAPMNDELLHATIDGVLAAAQARWEELRGELDPADAGQAEDMDSGAILGPGGFPAEAVRAAAALYGQAVVTAVTPEILARIAEGMDPEVVDEVIATVAEVAREERNGTVLRRIRRAGLERLAAEGLAAEIAHRTADGVPAEELTQFLSSLGSFSESARQEALDYIDRGGNNVFVLAMLLAEKMTPEQLAELLPLRDWRIRLTADQAIAVSPASGKDGS